MSNSPAAMESLNELDEEVPLAEPFERLIFTTDQPSSDDDQGSNNVVHIDLVHVTGVCPVDNRLMFSEFGLADSSLKRRELVFESGQSGFLTGDLVHEFIQQESMCLLRDLLLAARQDTSETKKGIIFVAYDLGALVVKKALAIASGFQNEYSSIFWKTSRVVFAGCPQRRMDALSMVSKLGDFLSSKLDTKSRRVLIPQVMEHLAHAAMQTTEAFIGTKIALRTSIIHLYAGEEDGGMIHASMDVFAATMGLSGEIAIQEHNDSTPRFPTLANALAQNLPASVSHPDWLPIEKTFLALAARPPVSQLDPRRASALQPLIDTKEHVDWYDFRGAQILYIQGRDYSLTHSAADYIMLEGKYKLAVENSNKFVKCRSFRFDSRDPRRHSISDMMASWLVQSVSGRLADGVNRELHVIRNLFLMRGGGTDKSAMSLFESIWYGGLFYEGEIVALHDFDECDRESRRRFLNYYSALSNKGECAFKLVITSREPHALTTELDEWLKLDVDAHVTDKSDISEPRDLVADLARFCPSDIWGRKFREHLGRLSTMEPANLDTILGLVFNHTGWPEAPSRRSLSEFTRLLSLVSHLDTPEMVLDKIIRSDENADLLGWILSWLQCSYHPLSLDELAAVVEHYNESKANARTAAPAESREQLRCRLRMFTDFRDDQATIRLDIMGLFVDNTDTTSFIWNQVAEEAHQMLAEFCLGYLKSEAAIASLADTIRQFESALQEQQTQFKTATLVLPKDQSVLLYAVQALPYHLSKCPPSYSTAALSIFLDNSNVTVSTLWAKAYWAMSNPLSRAPEPPESALSVCASFEFLTYDTLTTMATDLSVQCMSSAILSGKGSSVLGLVQPSSLTMPTCMELLLSAFQANDQATALDLARTILSHPERQSHTDMPPWPHLAIWTAVWLDMVDVARILLDSGVGVEMDPTIEISIQYWPSLLYLASVLNHASIAETLLDRGAISKSAKPETYGCFQNAVFRGHLDVVQKYLDHDVSVINDQQPYTGLWAAAEYGSWHSVDALVSAGADVNKPQGQPTDDSRIWTPLAIACRNRYPKTVEALLARGADANAIGPYGVDTALWFVTASEPDLACVRIMLKYNADPNHSLFTPPLMIELARQSHDSTKLIPVCDALLNGIRPLDLNATTSDKETALMVASRSRKLGLVEWLLANGADTDVLDSNNKSALYHAISYSHVDAVAALIKNGSRTDMVDDNGEGSLLFSALDSPEILRLLVDSGIDVNLTNSSGNAAINVASSQGKVEAAKILIDGGADINHQDAYGWLPIEDAVGYCQSVALTRLLAEKGAKLDVKGLHSSVTLLHRALNSDIEILKVLLEFRKAIDIDSPDSLGCTPLHSAVIGQLDVSYVQALIRAGAMIDHRNFDGESPLHSAARDANARSYLQFLLEQPDIDLNNPSPRYGSPLCVAALSLNVEGVRALLEHKADVNFSMPNVFGSTPLISVLCMSGLTARSENMLTIDVIARMLVFNSPTKANVKQEVPGSRFYTALSAACLCASPATLKFLLDEGTDVHLGDPDTNRLPHHFAAANGFDNFQATILSYRKDLMAADKENKNCLHWAAQFGNLKTVQYIMSRLNDDKKLRTYINQPDSDGWTPLCWAARPCVKSFGHIMRSEPPDYAGVVKALLLNGARKDVKCTVGTDTEFLTPLDLARRCDAGEEIIEMLQHGLEDRIERETSSMAVIEGPVRIYMVQDTLCDICFNQIIGRVYKCTTCADYDVCTKCLAHIGTFHTKETQRDGKDHEMELSPDCDEYRDMPDPEEAGENDDAEKEPDAQVEEDGGGSSPGRDEEILDLDDIDD